MESLIRSLQETTGDVVVVATVDSLAADEDINAVRREDVRESRQGHRSERGKDNGLLMLVAVKDRKVQDRGRLRPRAVHHRWVRRRDDPPRDGAAVQARRLRRGTRSPASTRIIGRIAEGRNVALQGAAPAERRRSQGDGSGGSLIVAMIVLFILINVIAGRIGRRRRRRWGGGPWSGWNSGVGPFGGGFGGRRRRVRWRIRRIRRRRRRVRRIRRRPQRRRWRRRILVGWWLVDVVDGLQALIG